jgi:ABC-type long-subunit fatty acid transport system fused permease/ATPase subunit
MSDSDSDVDSDSISDSSNAPSDDDDAADDAADDDEEDDDSSMTVRELYNQLRANDPRLLANYSKFDLSNYIAGYSETESIEVFQALKENTSVKHIRLWIDAYTTEAAAEYVESSLTLQTLQLSVDELEDYQEICEMVSLYSLRRALS